MTAPKKQKQMMLYWKEKENFFQGKIAFALHIKQIWDVIRYIGVKGFKQTAIVISATLTSSIRVTHI